MESRKQKLRPLGDRKKTVLSYNSGYAALLRSVLRFSRKSRRFAKIRQCLRKRSIAVLRIVANVVGHNFFPVSIGASFAFRFFSLQRSTLRSMTLKVITLHTLMACCSGLILASCSTQTMPPQALEVQHYYLSFEQYADLLTRCNRDEILQAFANIDDSNLPSIPLKDVRLCTPKVLVLNMQSFWASEEYLIVNIDTKHVFRLEVQSAGGYCATSNDCEILTIEECKTTPNCQQFRLAILSDEKGNEISRISLDSEKSMDFTGDDLLRIAEEGPQGHIYLHLGDESLVAKNGDLVGLETPSEIHVRGLFKFPMPIGCSYFSHDMYATDELRCGDILPRLDMSHAGPEMYTKDAFQQHSISRVMDFCRHGNLEHEVQCSNPTQIEEGTTSNGLRYIRFYLTSLEKHTNEPNVETLVGPIYVLELARHNEDKATFLPLLPRSFVTQGISPLFLVTNEALLQSIAESIMPLE